MPLALLMPVRAAEPFSAADYWRQAGDLDETFLKEAQAARASIPAPLWRIFQRHGWRVHLTASVVDAAPFLRGVHPRGWPVGATWENADAVHLPQHRMVIVASHRLNRKGERVRAHRVGGVLRHELGHAIDVALGGGRVRLSDTTEFRDCYFSDLERMQSRSESLAYYARNGESGPTETFAELLADRYGGGSDTAKAQSLRQTFIDTRRFLSGALPKQSDEIDR